jgi:hypothetical protein
MYLLDAIKACGRNGVVARDNQESVASSVVLIRSFDAATGRLIAISATEHDMGNWDPTLEDKTARDWYVVSTSLFGFKP